MRDSLASVVALLDESVGVVSPAAQLVVVDGGQMCLEHAAGAASLRTRFDLASLTKPLCTAALVLRLRARGLIDYAARPRPDATVRSLLSHSAGLPGWRRLGDPARPSIEMRAQAVEHARTEPLVYGPGTQSIYSDLGYVLLGDAIERATASTLDAIFLEEIARPLGADIGFGPIVGDVASTERGLVGVVHDDNCRAMCGVAGHAGLFADARAVSILVAAWVDAWHGATTSFDPALVREAFVPCKIPSSTWGLGWDHPSATASSAGTRWPRDGVGHLGFTGCSIWIDPPRHRWVILLTNRVNPTRSNEAIKVLRPRLHDAVVAALDDV